MKLLSSLAENIYIRAGGSSAGLFLKQSSNRYGKYIQTTVDRNSANERQGV